MNMKNLKHIISEQKQMLESSRFFEFELSLTDSFKQKLRKFVNTNDTFTFKQSTTLWYKKSENKMVLIDNVGFYYAVIITPLIKVLLEYKNVLYTQILKDKNKDEKETLIKDAKTKINNNLVELIKQYNNQELTNNDKDNLIEFVSDYSTWGGAKDICRGDFWQSASFNFILLINASSSYIVDIAKLMDENEELFIAGQELLGKFRENKISDDYSSTMDKELADQYFDYLVKVNNLEKNSAKTYVSMLRKLPERIKKINGESIESPFIDQTVLTDEASLERIETLLDQGFDKLVSEKETGISNTLFDLNKTKTSIKKFKNFIQWNHEQQELSPNKEYIPSFNKDLINMKRQIINFGAPGTGKSFQLNKQQQQLFSINNVERITFHPNMSYGQFVGVFKPFPELDTITYKYVPGVLMQQLVKALIHPDSAYLLIIEELNRANVSSVFGDMFQLLDRNNEHESEYPINIGKDIEYYFDQYVYRAPELAPYIKNMTQKILIRGGLVFPPNLYIWTTMNSSDQGVSPMDTAFKRRWDQCYFGVDSSFDEHLFSNYKKIKVNNSSFDGSNGLITWNDIRIFINNELSKINVPEDKLMGPYFISKNQLLSTDDELTETFKNKVLMYLFDDAVKQSRRKFFDLEHYRFSELLDKFDKDGIKIFRNCDSLVDKIQKIEVG